MSALQCLFSQGSNHEGIWSFAMSSPPCYRWAWTRLSVSRRCSCDFTAHQSCLQCMLSRIILHNCSKTPSFSWFHHKITINLSQYVMMRPKIMVGGSRP